MEILLGDLPWGFSLEILLGDSLGDPFLRSPLRSALGILLRDPPLRFSLERSPD